MNKKQYDCKEVLPLAEHEPITASAIYQARWCYSSFWSLPFFTHNEANKPL